MCLVSEGYVINVIPFIDPVTCPVRMTLAAGTGCLPRCARTYVMIGSLGNHALNTRLSFLLCGEINQIKATHYLRLALSQAVTLLCV